MRLIVRAASAGRFSHAVAKAVRSRVRLAAAAAAATLLFSNLAVPASSLAAPGSRMNFAQARARVRPAFVPPKRLQATEPARIKPVTAPSRTIRATVVRASGPTSGHLGSGLPLLSPSEIARRIAAHDKGISTQSRSVAPAFVPSRSVPVRKGGPTRGAVRHAEALTQDGGPFDTTGVTPWWAYHQDAIPGGGRLLVNEGLGNVLVQDEDMAVPHKRVPLDFDRTYNAQGAATTVIGVAYNWTSLYGNGWTNSLDAHVVAPSTSLVSVYDVDGARYDYSFNGATYTSVTPGQHATLTSDGFCGIYWTQKSGLTYYFWVPYKVSTCTVADSVYNTETGFLGHLAKIIGRNANDVITLGYSWDNPSDMSAATGKISGITTTTESGLSAKMSFADVNGRRLLQTLTYPDNSTTISYGYDSSGNLTSVTKPPNNSTGTIRQAWYGYTVVGSDSVMAWASSPRWAAQCNVDNCGGDGAYLGIAVSGSSAATSAPTSIQHFAVVNPTINDGYAAYGAIQSGHPTYAYAYRTDYYNFASWTQFTQTGSRLSTYRDTDGHMFQWFVDASGRPTQTQVCRASSAQGTQCANTDWLWTSQTWDANNNLVASIDVRGAETDMAYDAAGNVVAVAQPPQYSGYARPTTLIDYDSHNNVTAVCDPALVHASALDWNGTNYSGGSDSYCSSHFSTGHVSALYSSPSYEPYGELTSLTSASGYTRQIAYNTGPQGGTDFGLPTNFTVAAPITQFGASSRQPSSSFTYDTHGNLICLQADAGANGVASSATTVATYDSLNRVTAMSDPDDASLPGSCSKTAGIAGSTIVTRSTYYPDGSPQTTQSPSQAAANSGTVVSYDLDGNETSEAPYTGTPSSPQTATMRRWFDAVGRLVETQEPADPNTSGDLPISLRYVYDLSQNGTSGTATTVNGTTLTGFGNMFDTEKNTPSGWIDFTFAAFDSADRVTTTYAFAPCPAQLSVLGAVYCSQAPYATHYYWDSSSLNSSFSGNGLLVATMDGMGVTKTIGYDGLSAIDSLQYSGDNGRTPQVSFAYDFDERMSDMWNAFPPGGPLPGENHVSFSYTADGLLYQKNNTVLNTTVGYSYYPDGVLAGVSGTAQTTTNGVKSYVVNQPNMYQYAYRNDGMLSKENFGAASQAVSWTYTRGGRMTAQNDFGGATSISAQYNDGHGRLSSYTTPSGTYGAFVYDALGRVTSYTDPYASVDRETVGSTYDLRGDLVGRTYSGGTASSKPGFQYTNIQGVLVQDLAHDQWDGRTGAMLVTYGGGNTYDAIGRLTYGAGSILTYDGENRIYTGDTFAAASAEDYDCHSGGALASWAPPTPELDYWYDGLGQMFQDRQPNTTGFRGATMTHYRQWIWDGGNPLFTLGMSATWSGNVGAAQSYSADGHGSIDPFASTLTLSDQDFDGAIAQYHNATGHSAWNATNPFNQFCISANSLPQSPNYVGPSNGSIPDDGSSDQSLVVDSYGRGYLSGAMGFTTPDVTSATPYAGRTALGSRFSLSTEPAWYSDNSCPSGKRYVDSGLCVPKDIGRTRGKVDPFIYLAPWGFSFGGLGPSPAIPKAQKLSLCIFGTSPTKVNMLATGYDNGFGSTGKRPGDPGYGETATGTTAQYGTIAADPRFYNGRTSMFVPGYGKGWVQDTGGAIKGPNRIDLWFPSADAAFAWGRRSVSVTVCR